MTSWLIAVEGAVGFGFATYGILTFIRELPRWQRYWDRMHFCNLKPGCDRARGHAGDCCAMQAVAGHLPTWDTTVGIDAEIDMIKNSVWDDQTKQNALQRLEKSRRI